MNIYDKVIFIMSILFLSFFILGTFFCLLTYLLELIEQIRNMVHWKRYKGTYVIAKFRKDKEGRKTNNIYYVSDIGKRHCYYGRDITKALKFNNQKEALDKIKECTIEEFFILKL